VWERLGRDSARLLFMPEWAKLAQITHVMPIGSVDNERRFSLMNDIHTADRNRLQPEHLNDCMRIAAAKHHTFLTLDMQNAHRMWSEEKQRRKAAT
jgi:hypothetical protein